MVLCRSRKIYRTKKAEIVEEAEKRYLEYKQEKQKLKFINEEVNKISSLALEISDGTKEGFIRDAKALEQASFGSLLVKISEFGLFLKNADTNQLLLLNMLNESYNGKISDKSIKGEKREKDIKNMPVNALLYSDPTLFEKDIKENLNQLLSTGLGRRSFIIFQNKREEMEIEKDAEKALKEEEIYYKEFKIIAYEFINIFNQISKNSVYELTKETYKTIFYPYKLSLLNKEREFTQNSEHLLALEIVSRELKVLKLACCYAALNHPENLFIYPLDMEQAINSVELLGADFKKFLIYKPKHADKYDSLFNFFLENLDTDFTKTDLVSKHYHEFGVSRDKARENFDDFIEVISEIASEKGYFF